MFGRVPNCLTLFGKNINFKKNSADDKLILKKNHPAYKELKAEDHSNA